MNFDAFTKMFVYSVISNTSKYLCIHTHVKTSSCFKISAMKLYFYFLKIK